MITQVRVNEDDPAFNNPSKPIGKFFNEEQAKIMEEKYGYIMKEDAGRGYRRVVASPKPAEIIEIGTIRTMVESGDLVIACGGGGIPVTRQGNHLKGASAVIEQKTSQAVFWLRNWMQTSSSFSQLLKRLPSTSANQTNSGLKI